jgi:hypothetical protein
MSLAAHINDQFEKAPFDQASRIRISYSDLRVKVKLADWNRLGCLLERVDVEHSQGGKLTVNPSRIEEQVTYLGEKLGVLEDEGEGGTVILRSKPPRIDGGVSSFFEMVLNQNRGISLVRYKHDPQFGQRVQVPSALTRDALERLVSDLIGLAQEN